MTAFPHYEVQKAVYTALASSAPLVEVLPQGVASVTAGAPPDLGVPYVLVAQTVSAPVLSPEDGLEECRITCEVASEQAGGGQARKILALVAAALAAPVVVAGYQVVLQHRGESTVALLADGRTYRGALTLRMVLQKTGE